MNDTRATNVITAKKKTTPLLVDVCIRLMKKPLGVIGLCIILIFLFTGIFADFLAPYGYNECNPADRLSPPGGAYILGTDNLGRDLLSRVIYGARISMFVGLGATALEVIVALFLGILSGFLRGKFDLIMQRFVDAIMCFPHMILAMTVISITGPGIIQLIFVLGLVGGIGRGTRVTRSAVLRISEMMYIDAARAMGAPNWRIMLKHIFPNIVPPTIILFSTSIGFVILAEASLSFLGFGVPPPFPSWGGMLSTKGLEYMLSAPWMAVWPGLALGFVVFGINMLGDALRDILDPRMRGTQRR